MKVQILRVLCQGLQYLLILGLDFVFVFLCAHFVSFAVYCFRYFVLIKIVSSFMFKIKRKIESEHTQNLMQNCKSYMVCSLCVFCVFRLTACHFLSVSHMLNYTTKSIDQSMDQFADSGYLCRDR